MIVKSKPLSEMFSGRNIQIYFSQEYQPYVRLEDVLEQPSVLTEKNVTISCCPGLSKIPFEPVETIKTEVKEEQFSEHIDDIAVEINENPPIHNMSVCFPQEDPVAIKSEEEDHSFELYSSQESVINYESNSGDLLEDVTTSRLEEDFDLHLSPDSDNSRDETYSESENPDDSSTTKTNKKPIISPEGSTSKNERVNRTPDVFVTSPDMFEESPEVNSQGSSLNPDSSSGPAPSLGDNRERLVEWDTQELSDVSQRLRLRTKQAKRLIMEVIRKRQMEDETLDAFKKRLRRM